MERTKKPHPKDGWYKISPGNAAVLLDKMCSNRIPRNSRIRDIADDIKAGRYVPNGESIVMTPGGVVLDGQHRLKACVKADKPIVSYVVHVSSHAKTVFDSLDQSAQRNGADRLALDGYENTRLLSAIVRGVILYERGYYSHDSPAGSIKPYEIRLRTEKNKEEFIRCTTDIRHYAKELLGVMPTAIVGVVHYFACQQNLEQARKFLDGFATGTNLAKNNPAHQLQRVCINWMRREKKPTRRIRFAYMIKAWCLFRDQKTTKVLAWKPPNESFPEF